jgi:hypothetical protein
VSQLLQKPGIGGFTIAMPNMQRKSSKKKTVEKTL